jgi:hypothetical protein
MYKKIIDIYCMNNAKCTVRVKRSAVVSQQVAPCCYSRPGNVAESFETYDKKIYCKQSPYLFPCTTKHLSERVCAFMYGVYWFRSALNGNGRHQQSLVKLSNSIKLRAVWLQVAAFETKHCCYHSHHDNHSAVATRLGEMRCGKDIYNAWAYVIDWHGR